jgi:hypothetical protein
MDLLAEHARTQRLKAPKGRKYLKTVRTIKGRSK